MSTHGLPEPFDVLTCKISRSIQTRVLVGHKQIESLYEEVRNAFAISLSLSDTEGKRFLERNGIPFVAIQLSDGSVYKEPNILFINRLKTFKGRRIEKIEIASQYGPMKASVSMDCTSTFRSCHISVEGPEDKATVTFNGLLGVLNEKRDITSFAFRIPDFIYAVAISLFLVSGLAYSHLNLTSASILSPNTWRIVFTVLIVLLSSSIIQIPVYMLRDRYLTPVAFLWGENQSENRIVTGVCVLLFITVPVGVGINLYSSLML